jgi:hypothetical protein
MRKSFIFLFPLVAGLLTLFATREAHALGPLDIEIAAKVGYGSDPSNGAGLSRLGFGVGGRAGIALFGIYAGVNIVDYLGGTAGPESCPPMAGTHVDPACAGGPVHALMYGGEFGYGFKISIVTIRPQIGIGSVLVSSPIANTSSLYLEPGVTGLVAIGILLLGVDANIAIFPDASAINNQGSSALTAFTIHGQVGVRF